MIRYKILCVGEPVEHIHHIAGYMAKFGVRPERRAGEVSFWSSVDSIVPDNRRKDKMGEVSRGGK